MRRGGPGRAGQVHILERAAGEIITWVVRAPAKVMGCGRHVGRRVTELTSPRLT